MDRLILFRHGKAENESASGDDFDRRLAPRGLRESAEMGETLARLGLIPDVALVSPAARAQETWAAAQPAFPQARTQLEPELYNADPGTILQAAEAAGRGCGVVMVVGHNPGLQELTVRLLVEGSAAPAVMARPMRQFPPAAAAVFLIDANGRPAFDGLFFPERGG
ncbi:SixA phosphatase family protein [Phenylobacterium sp.]|uniref:SixA phosphatase family protein n=1 Tax=Phenylobacterium sp. TaxID=1871053 RepID=UPI002DE31CA2|nr:histidine phosphatase family protein [Phenylobacterium sp.]